MRFLVLTMIVRVILSSTDLNVDAELSDIEVQEFSKEESGESESEDSKSDNNSTASDEPESFNFRCLHFSHGRRGTCWSASFFLFVRSSNQRSGIDTYFGSSFMYLFVILLFLNRNALDRSAKHLISNWPRTPTIDGLVQLKRKRRWNKIPNWTMLYPQINMLQLVWRAEKGNVYSE